MDLLTDKYSQGYYPYELSLDLPEVTMIFLDGCGGDSWHRLKDSPSLYTAHTHMCKLDPIYNSICIMRDCLRNSDGTVSDVVWHEYGHVISIIPDNVILGHGKVVGTHIVGDGYPKNLGWEDFTHGKIFAEAMTRLGKPHLISRYTTVRT